MKCAECGKMHHGLNGLNFKSVPKRAHYDRPAHDALCRDCLLKPKKIVIDHAVNREIPGEEEKEIEYPF